MKVETHTTGQGTENVPDEPSNPPEDPSTPAKTAELSKAELNSMAPADKAALHTHDIPELCDKPADAPAARIRLTSSSGFYVRSFAHDLGIACGSYATMSELSRTRQSGYTIKDPPPEGQTLCLTYDDIKAGEDVWGPKIGAVLEEWMAKNPAVTNANKPDDRDRRNRQWNRGQGNSRGHQSNYRQGNKRQRRNSSSPDI